MFKKLENMYKNNNSGGEELEQFVPVVVETRALSDHEILTLVIARIAKDRDTCEMLLNLLEEVEVYKLSGTLHKVSLERDLFWTGVERQSTMSSSMIDDLLSGGSISDGLKYLQILKKVLHDTAVPALELHSGLTYSGDNPVLLGMFEQPGKIATGLVLQKESEMKNFVNKLIKTIDPKIAQTLTTESKKMAFLRGTCDKIFNYQFDLNINSKSYRTPKEAGICLPHFMPPKVFLTASVSALIDDQFQGAICTAFFEEDFSSITPYNGDFSEVLLVSRDVNSPYHIGSNPALYVKGDVDGTWAWRQTQKSLRLKIAGEVRSNQVRGEVQDVEKVLKHAELEEVLEYITREKKSSVDYLDRDRDQYLSEIHDQDEALFSGKKAVLFFYKRGYSKKDEVGENPDCVHVVKASVAGQFSSDDYYPIALPDFQSVVLLPMKLWKLSKQYARNSDKLLNSKFGFRFMKGDASFKVAVVYNLLQATLSFRVMDNLLNPEYDFYSDVEHLRDGMSNGALAGLLSLLPFGTERAKKAYVATSFHYVSGMNDGSVIVCAQSSRKGKDEMNELVERAGMERLLDQFDDPTNKDDYEGFSLASFYGRKPVAENQSGTQTSSIAVETKMDTFKN